MNLDDLFVSLFGYKEILNVDISFWVVMAIIALVVVVMNLVYWNTAPSKS